MQSKRTTRAESEDHLCSADHSLRNADIWELNIGFRGFPQPFLVDVRTADIKLGQGNAKFTKLDQVSRNSWRQKCAAEQDPYWVATYIRVYRKKFSCHEAIVLGICVPLRPRFLPSASLKYTVDFLMIKANEMHYFSTLFGAELYMFRKDLLSIIRCLNTVFQRFSNFFQVGTTFISQNVLRTTLLLGLSNSLGLP